MKTSGKQIDELHQFSTKHNVNNLRVNFHDVVNINPRPMHAVEILRKASEIFVVAAFLMIWVSSDSLLSSSPVRVTSKKAIS